VALDVEQSPLREAMEVYKIMIALSPATGGL
jgi:hypothetical protein